MVSSSVLAVPESISPDNIVRLRRLAVRFGAIRFLLPGDFSGQGQAFLRPICKIDPFVV